MGNVAQTKKKKTYLSKNPVRKATLLKKVALDRLREEENVREFLNPYFD